MVPQRGLARFESFTLPWERVEDSYEVLTGLCSNLLALFRVEVDEPVGLRLVQDESLVAGLRFLSAPPLVNFPVGKEPLELADAEVGAGVE